MAEDSGSKMGKVAPRVSVLMPAYNAGMYISEAVKSILNQTFEDFELIICDDGSLEECENVLNTFEDTRIIRIKNEKNIGLIKTLARLIHAARGEYIVRMDADDISEPDRIEKQVKFMDSNQRVSIAGSWVRTIGLETKEITPPTNKTSVRSHLLFGNPLLSPTLIIRRSHIEKAGLTYAEKYRYENEYDFYIQAVKKGLILENIGEFLVRKRRHELQMTHFFESRVKEVEVMQIQRNYFDFLLKHFAYYSPKICGAILLFIYRRLMNRLSFEWRRMYLKKKEWDFYRVPLEKCPHINCSVKPLGDKNIIDLATVGFNNPEVIQWQIQLLRKFMADPYVYSVFDNSSDMERSQLIRKVCDEEKIPYVRLPKNYHTRSSSHGSCLNWIYKHYICKRGAYYFGYLDHDVFPTKRTRVIPILEKQPIYGLLHERKHLWYLWAGFCFFRASFITQRPNFMDGNVQGIALDTGGMNWGAIYSRIDKNKIEFAPEYLERIRDSKIPAQKLTDTSIDNIDHMGDWIHTFSASGWKKMKSQIERENIIKSIIGNMLV